MVSKAERKELEVLGKIRVFMYRRKKDATHTKKTPTKQKKNPQPTKPTHAYFLKPLTCYVSMYACTVFVVFDKCKTHLGPQIIH